MSYLILSDIHGNLEALQAVISDAAGRYEQILCLGDLVGYGADPNAVTEWVEANAAVVIRGNHDRICSSEASAEYYNPAAQASVLWTRAALTESARTYLRNLPRGPVAVDEFDLTHGSPLDEDEYLIGIGDVSSLRGHLQSSLTWFGHTHLQGGFLLSRGGVKRIAANRPLEIEPNYYFLINPGSVGQPRDGDWRAAYAVYSPVERTVEFRRVAYDVDRAAGKIRKAGLPDFLAVRLYEGT